MTDPVPDLTTRQPDTDQDPAAMDDGMAGRQRGRLHQRLHAHPLLALTTKIVVTLVGGLVVLAGVVMIFTPGQGILAIVLGLAILSTEYAWAERWLRAARQRAAEAKRRASAMDPKVRRRRMFLGAAAMLLAIAAVTVYLVAFDWPNAAVAGWNWVQSLAGWAPDLPGM